MSIKDQEQFHSVVLRRLWLELSSKLPNAHFHLGKGSSQSSYILKAVVPALLGKGKTVSTGVFIKYSSARVTPWRYVFKKSDQDEIQKLKQVHGEVFIAFVNGLDGIACISFDQLKTVLDDIHEEQEWVAVSRKPRQSYRFSGNDGEGEQVLARNSFPDNIVEYFSRFFKK